MRKGNGKWKTEKGKNDDIDALIQGSKGLWFLDGHYGAGSIAGTEPMTAGGAYAASKWGLRGWSLSTWANLRHKNVKVCLINPAYVNTPMAAGPRVIQKNMIQVYAWLDLCQGPCPPLSYPLCRI